VPRFGHPLTRGAENYGDVSITSTSFSWTGPLGFRACD